MLPFTPTGAFLLLLFLLAPSPACSLPVTSHHPSITPNNRHDLFCSSLRLRTLDGGSSCPPIASAVSQAVHHRTAQAIVGRRGEPSTSYDDAETEDDWEEEEEGEGGVTSGAQDDGLFDGSDESADDEGGNDDLDDGEWQSNATNPVTPSSPVSDNSTYPTTQYASYRSTDSVSDCSTLASLFVSLGGANWLNTDGWRDSWVGDTSFACCDYYGVKCNSFGRVTALDLDNNGLQGPLDDRVFGLPYLNRLKLSSNALTGSIPDRLLSTPALKSIYLDNNQMSGPLPPSFALTTSLVNVHLSNNSFTGPLALPSASRLAVLYAQRNNFDGRLSIAANDALEKVVLDYNRFQGPLPDFASLPNLELFTAAANEFTGGVSGLEQAEHLRRFDVSHNALTGSYPDPSRLTNLTDFIIVGNAWEGRFPSSKAPPSLGRCVVDTLDTDSCPHASALASPDSLASVCRVECPEKGRALLQATTPRVVDVAPFAGIAYLPSRAGSYMIPTTLPNGKTAMVALSSKGGHTMAWSGFAAGLAALAAAVMV